MLAVARRTGEPLVVGGERGAGELGDARRLEVGGHRDEREDHASEVAT